MRFPGQTHSAPLEKVLFGPLTEVSRLTLDSSAEAATLLEPRTEEEPCFNVELRLVDRPVNRLSPADMVEELSQQIPTTLSRGAKISWSRRIWIAVADAPPQLLFVYHEPSNDGPIPSELEQLYIEWMDSEQELGRLYYQRIAATHLRPWTPTPVSRTSSPPTARWASPTARPEADTLNLVFVVTPRARAVASPTLRVAADWAAHGLRLFVPYSYHRMRWTFIPILRFASLPWMHSPKR